MTAHCLIGTVLIALLFAAVGFAYGWPTRN